MIAIALRALFHLDNLVTDQHLDILGKVLLATGLMTAYGYVFEVFDALYSGNVHEIQTLNDRLSGEYWWSYWGAVFFNFVVLQPLWLRTVRRTPWMLFAISTSVAVGMWLERYMILVTSLYRDFLVSSWGIYRPTFWDWAIYAGTIGLFLVPFLLIIRLLPVISIFETKEVLHEEQEEGARA
jgi:molybdopterin-containing oxidoreductase family membrane subunit